VVAGTRTPLHIEELQRANPTIYSQFLEVAQGLERHYRDMQDMEFTVERGKLWMLQTRSGKRTARAAIKIAVDMVNEGLITKEEAVQRIEPSQVDAMLHPSFDQKAKDEAISRGDLLATGLNASPGAATGVAVFDSERAMQRAQAGEDVVLVRPETSPDDVGGMLTSRGVLTQHGGATSHAAVVARGNNLPCVAGARISRWTPRGASSALTAAW
jgi:pyruvate,orthophosphate dikinase